MCGLSLGVRLQWTPASRLSLGLLLHWNLRRITSVTCVGSTNMDKYAEAYMAALPLDCKISECFFVVVSKLRRPGQADPRVMLLRCIWCIGK